MNIKINIQHTAALFVVLVGSVDQIINNYAEVELLNSENEVSYISMPMALFPCIVEEGSLFYIYNSAQTTEIRCGRPPEQ